MHWCAGKYTNVLKMNYISLCGKVVLIKLKLPIVRFFYANLDNKVYFIDEKEK